MQITKNIKIGQCQSILFNQTTRDVNFLEQFLVLLNPNLYRSLILKKSNRPWVWKKLNGTVSWNYENSPSILGLIVGSSGSGKSTLAKSIYSQFSSEGFSVIIIDPHGEYNQSVLSNGGRCFSSLKTSISLLELNGLSPSLASSEFVSILKGVMPAMGDIQAYYLNKATMQAYEKKGIFENSKSTWQKKPPSLADVNEQISQLIYSSKKPDSSIYSLKRRIDTLSASGIFSSKTHLPFQLMLNQLCSFDLSDIRSNEAQMIYVEVFLRKIYSYVQTKKINSKILVVIDEAQNICKNSQDWTSFAGKIYQGGRKFGLNMLLISQGFEGLDSAISANSSAIFSFFSREPKDLEQLSGLFCSNKYSEKSKVFLEEYSNLEQFQCFFTCTTNSEILKVNIEKPKTQNNSKSDNFVLGSMHQFLLFKKIKELLPNEKIIYNDFNTLQGNELDMSFPNRKVVLELDGMPFHSTEKQLEKDRIKDEKLNNSGWKVYRILDDAFSEKEIGFQAKKFVNWLTEQN